MGGKIDRKKIMLRKKIDPEKLIENEEKKKKKKQYIEILEKMMEKMRCLEKDKR